MQKSKCIFLQGCIIGERFRLIILIIIFLYRWICIKGSVPNSYREGAFQNTVIYTYQIMNLVNKIVFKRVRTFAKTSKNSSFEEGRGMINELNLSFCESPTVIRQKQNLGQPQKIILFRAYLNSYFCFSGSVSSRSKIFNFWYRKETTSNKIPNERNAAMRPPADIF